MKIRLFYTLVSIFVLSTANALADSYSIDLYANQPRLIANHLNNPNGNTLAELFSSMANKSQVQKWNCDTASFTVYSRTLSGWPSATLSPGEGAVLKSPVNATVTFTGTPQVPPVLPPTNMCNCGVFSLVGRQSTNNPSTFEDLTGYLPPEGAQVYRLIPGMLVTPVDTVNYTRYTYSGGAWDSGPPAADLGESVWIYLPCPTNECLSVLFPADKTVECGSPWDFNFPVVLTNCCTNLTITALSTTTNGDCPIIATRVWEINVPCTNSIICTQIVTVECCTNPCPPEPLLVFNTGVDTNGVVLTNGAVDPYYTLTTNPNGGGSNAVVVSPLPGGWLTNTSTSQWIGPTADGTGVDGTYTYEITFNVPCTNEVVITGQWAVDNDGSIQLNGSPTPVATLTGGGSGNFTTLHPFTITSGLVAGQNVLTFNVTNNGGFTGLRVELTGSATCCCPPTNTVALNSGYDQVAATTYGIGSADAFWTVISDPDGTTTEPRPATVIAKHNAWQPAQSASQWISSYPVAETSLNGTYVFETYFCVESDATNLLLNVCLRSDDAAGVFLNGNQITLSPPNTAFNTATPACGTANDQSWFVLGGQNTLRVQVTNIYAVAMGLNLAATVTGSSLSLDPAICCRPLSGISGQKFYDLNGNGVRNAGEPPLAGWTINLSGGGSTVTDSKGYYYFQDLPAGSYTVMETPQDGWTQTAPGGGSHNVTLGNAQQVNLRDFGNTHTNINTNCVYIFCPSNIVTACTDSGAVVPFTVTATNLCSSNDPIVFCTPPSLTWFAIGTATVNCTAYDPITGDYATCSFTVTVVDNTPPVINCVSNKTVPCNTNWTFDMPSAFDACCANLVTLQLISSNKIAGPCPNVWRGVWRATDCSSNSITCTQLVTVVDTIPPVINCVSNKTVPCGTNWTFDLPSAFDNCCTNLVTVQLISSNKIAGPCPDVFQGVWRATDCCSNSITCTQLVTVVDTIPPVINCVSNKTVPCNTNWTFDVPSAFDACCTNLVTLQLISSNMIAGPCPDVWRGVWQATDCCSNSITCTQLVTVECCTNPCPPEPLLVFNTGVDTNGVVLTNGAIDPHYTLTTNPNSGSSNAFVIAGNGLTNTSTSKWIGPAAGNSTNGTYVYRMTFDLPCTSNAIINVQWAVDNSGTVYLNGSATPVAGSTIATLNSSSFTTWHQFSISTGLVPGQNTLDFAVTNDGVGPTALRVELSGSATCCCVPPPTNMISWWPGDGNANDIVGGNSGTLNNGITFSQGEVGQAFSFDGTNDYVEIPHSATLDLSFGHTVDLWVKVDAYAPAGNYRMLISKWANGVEDKSLAIDPTGKVKYYLFNCFGGVPLASITTLALGTWYHIAATYDGATAKIYINGVLDASMSASGNVADSNGKLYFGHNPGLVASGAPAVPFKGQADEIEWFNRALTTNEIAAIYNAGSLGKCKPCSITFTCATNKTVSCGTNWNFNAPTNIIDTCCTNYSLTFNTVTNSGPCPLVTTRTWVVSDVCGNTNTCSQTVTVVDITPPTINCPTNTTIVALDTNCQLRIPRVRPRATDNCTPSSQLVYTQTPTNDAVVAGPCQYVTVTVTDLCGNSNQCQVLVCGQDKTPPKVVAPKSLTLTNCVVPNVLPFLTASDNCTASNKLVFTQSPAAGTTIAAGGNTVTVTVKDLAGNTTTITIWLINSGSTSFLPNLFNTGVDNSKAVLPVGSVDPHYTLGPVPVGTPTGPGKYNVPNAIVVTNPWGLPPFTVSRWIAPMTNSVNCPAGPYTYTNRFTLPSGANPLTAAISGRWAADNGARMYFNGLAPGNEVPSSSISTPNGHTHWTYFTINNGFLAFPTVNTLYCVVTNQENYTGLRVEITNAVVNCVTCTPPSIVSLTRNLSRKVNSTAVFNVNVSGTPPLTFQWYHNGLPLANGGHYSGVNTPTLTISPVGYADAGSYYLVISNPCGGISSAPRKLTVTKGRPWPWGWWSFEQIGNPMAASYGPDLIPVGTNNLGISSGTTADFDLPNIGGNVANVIYVPPLPGDTFIQLPLIAPPGSNSVSSYTFIMDIYSPGNSSGPNSTLITVGDLGTNGVEVAAGTNGVIIVSGTAGGEPLNLVATTPMLPDTWNRLALVMDNPETNALDDASLTLYLNGEFAGMVTFTGVPHVPVLPGLTIDWSLAIPATLLSSPQGTSNEIYASSIQFHAEAMTPEMIAGLSLTEDGPIPGNDTSVGVHPVLSATTSNSIVNFSWTGSTFTLQETPDLASGVWVDSVLYFDEIEVSGDIFTTAHANPANQGPAKFYRLIYTP